MVGPLDSLKQALVDRYRVERELGRGGMATVYLARDLKHDRYVAVKVLRPDLAAVLGGERFLREIRLTAQLQHPHILSLLDSGEAAGFLYYVMPYIEGESLRERLVREGQLPVDEALRITKAIAGALEYAHQRGVIHRDIKPENILLYQGEPMVADFGVALAAASAGRERLTETGLSLGTPAYMSPEQASASPKLDPRSDQYSLACVAYEMLAGEPPYTGPTAQAIIAKRFSEPIPHLSTVRAVPRAIEAAVTRALARSPADRFPNLEAFRDALDRGAPRWRVSRRAAALIGGIAVLAALSVVAFLQRMRPASGPTVSRQLTFTGRANEPVLSPDGKSVAYVSTNQSLTVQSLDGGEPLLLVPPSHWLFHPRWTGDGTAIVFCMMPDSNRLAATWMVPSVGGSPHEVLPDISAFDAGPDSSTAIWSPREGQRIEVVDLRTHQIRRRVPIADSLGLIDAVAWSPNRSWVAFQAKGIWITSFDEGSLRRLSPTGWDPRWSPSGAAVYFLDGPRGSTNLKRVRVDPRTGKLREGPTSVISLPTADRFSVAPGPTLVHNQVALSSQALAVRYSNGFPRRIEATQTLTEGTGWVNGISISDDGRQVALSRGRGGESSLEVVSFEGGPTRIVAGSPSEELGPSWSPDGSRLVFVRADSAGSRLMIMEYPNGGARRIASAAPDLMVLTKSVDLPLLPYIGLASAFWSKDGRWLSYMLADLRRVGLVDLERQTESFVRIPDSLGNGYIGGSMISPDGRQLVVSTLHKWNDWGELWLGDVTGKTWRRLREPFGESYPAQWTEDGWLYVMNNRPFMSDAGPSRMQLWRVSTKGGKPEYVALIPEGCSSFSLSRDARRAACDYNTRQSDLIVTTGFDPELR